MSELGEVLGAFLASVAHARRIADEESSAIAEYYRNTPLLEGMSLPRVRVPELILELPVLIESFDGGEESVPASKKSVRAALREELKDTAHDEDVRLPRTFLDSFERELQKELSKVEESGARWRKAYPAENTVRAVDKAFLRAVKKDTVERFSPEQSASIRGSLRRKANSVALKKEGRPPSLRVDILTSEVKERAGPDNVARLKLRLREEGLEWTVDELPDGSVSRSLTPE